MSVTAGLAVLDMVMGALEVATKANELLTKAHMEGRTVTDEEFEALKADNATKRAAWDEASK